MMPTVTFRFRCFAGQVVVEATHRLQTVTWSKCRERKACNQIDGWTAGCTYF